VLTVRRSAERRHRRRGAAQSWHAFHDRTRHSRLAGFKWLAGFDEYRLAKQVRVPSRPRRDALLLIYVNEGSLIYSGPLDASGVISTGGFACIDLDSRSRCVLTNASRTEEAHLFEIDLEPARPVREPGLEHRRFNVAQRRRNPCVIVSPDGLRGALLSRQDALLYSVFLEPGQHLAHALSPGRSAWLQVIDGEVRVRDALLTAGDSAALTAERVLSVTATHPCELLILDLGGNAR